MYLKSTLFVETKYFLYTFLSTSIAFHSRHSLINVEESEMRAMVIQQYGGTDQLVMKDIPIPNPSRGEVLVKVKAFGINRAETYMRRGLWGDVAKVSGIECVGEVAEDPAGVFIRGQMVAALMGGMGRTRNGSYAQYTCVPATNIIPLKTNMEWGDLAAIPESYATAWSCLHENMKIKSGDTVFIRGATSALGQAAINIASNEDNIVVIASTRNPNHVSLLKELGCNDVFLDIGDLSRQVREKYPQGIDSVMDIVGNNTLLDSLKMVSKGGYVCNAGFLGGGEPIQFNPLVDMPCSVNLNFFASYRYGSDDHPLSAVPLQTIVDKSAQGIYRNKPSRIFAFEDIAAAHELMEKNAALGKIVVRV